MAQKFLFSKSFILASFLLLFAGSAWAADGEDDDFIEAEVVGNTIYIETLDAWNKFVDAHVIGTYKIRDPYTKEESVYNYGDGILNTICLGPQYVYEESSPIFFDSNEQDGVKCLGNLPSDWTLTMSPKCYLTGDVVNAKANCTDGWGLVRLNRGTIRGLKIKDFNVEISNISFDYTENGQPANSKDSFQYFSCIAAVNDGVIEDCEVIDSEIILSATDGSNNKMIAAIASLENNSGGSSCGKISNCLVKDFKAGKSETVETSYTIYGAQLAAACEKTIMERITNNCTFVTNPESLFKTERNNYFPIVIPQTNIPGFKEDNSTYEDIPKSNRAFILCTGIDLDNGGNINYNINDGDDRIVRYYTESGNDGLKTFSTEDGFKKALKNYCSGSNFDYIAYSYEDFTEKYDFEDGNNKVEFSYYLPVAHSNYALTQKYNDKYIVKDEYDYCAMANMLANKGENETLEFIIGRLDVRDMDIVMMMNLVSVPYELSGITLPKGCSIEGAVEQILDPTIGQWSVPVASELILSANEQQTVKPLFSKIEEGAIVKNLTLSLSVAVSNAGTTGSGFTIADQNFGILAGENEGTIENCTIQQILFLDEEGNSEDENANKFEVVGINNQNTNIGALAGVNSGTVKNIISYIDNYHVASQCTTHVASFGGIVGQNKGTVSDVVQESFVASGSAGQSQSVYDGFQYGLFVGGNEGAATAKNLFAILPLYEGAESVLNYVDTDESKINTESAPDFVRPLTDVDKFRLIFSDKIGNVKDEFVIGGDVIRLFSEPSKWGYLSYENTKFLYLAYSDLDITFDDDNAVPNIIISDASDAAEAIFLLSSNHEVYGSANITLEGDIKLSTNPMVRPILSSFMLGDKEKPFTGKFNGKRHKISNIEVVADAGKIEVVKDADGNEVHVVSDLSLFGNIGKGGVLKNVNVENLVFNVQSTNEDVKNQDVLTIPLLAGANEGSMSHVSVSGIMRVDGSGFKDNAKINFSLVGNNDNEINNVSVFIANTGLLYKSVGDLETWFGSKSYTPLTDSLTFDNAYSYWANAMQVLKHSPKFYKEAVNNDVDLILPTFESFGTWYNQLPSDSLAAVTARIRNMNFIDASDLIHVARNLLGWYHKEAQKDLRAADQKSWTDYANTQPEGNNVAVVATQNLCKSPGKGRTHKVCSAPSGGSSNKVLLLNPYAKDVPETEMECTLDEFASGYAAHWLNYDEKGYSGSYNKMWSQGLLHPIMATDKNKYVVKLEYINEDAEDLGLEYTTYGKVGQTLDLFYTQKPTNVFLDDVELDNTTFAADHLSFVVPETPVGKGVVSVHVYFKGTPITDIDADGGISVSALQNRVIINGAERQQITVSNLQGVAVSSQQAQSDNVEISLPKGVYIVKAGSVTKKVLVE